MNYSELLQLAKGWGNFVSDRINIWRLLSKLPNLAALQTEYEKLQEQKEALRADYGKLKKQVKEYDVIKQNIDSILRQPREPEREKGKERG